MKSPDIRSSFEYNGEHYDVEWFDLPPEGPLPDIAWNQVYAIGNLDGRVPVVHYPNAKDNLPGGKVDPGETAEQTLRREIIEELNMRVLNWFPLGYQVVAHPNGRLTNELRVYATMQKIGEFVKDPGGNITGHTLIPLHELNERIQYGIVGERLLSLVKNEFGRRI